jgi:hypothetical protein
MVKPYTLRLLGNVVVSSTMVVLSFLVVPLPVFLITGRYSTWSDLLLPTSTGEWLRLGQGGIVGAATLQVMGSLKAWFEARARESRDTAGSPQAHRRS